LSLDTTRPASEGVKTHVDFTSASLAPARILGNHRPEVLEPVG